MRELSLGICAALVLMIGFALGQSSVSEFRAATILHGKSARLVGYDCGDRDFTAILVEEDDGPSCREVRPLRSE